MFTCRNCGQSWRRDPALEVACPECGAGVGSPCKRPSGHPLPYHDVHIPRDQLALDRGYIQRCPGAPTHDVVAGAPMPAPVASPPATSSHPKAAPKQTRARRLRAPSPQLATPSLWG